MGVSIRGPRGRMRSPTGDATPAWVGAAVGLTLAAAGLDAAASIGRSPPTSYSAVGGKEGATGTTRVTTLLESFTKALETSSANLKRVIAPADDAPAAAAAAAALADDDAAAAVVGDEISAAAAAAAALPAAAAVALASDRADATALRSSRRHRRRHRCCRPGALPPRSSPTDDDNDNGDNDAEEEDKAGHSSARLSGGNLSPRRPRRRVRLDTAPRRCSRVAVAAVATSLFAGHHRVVVVVERDNHRRRRRWRCASREFGDTSRGSSWSI